MNISVQESAASVSSTAQRRVKQIVRGRATSDGAGVKLTRVIGSAELPDLDPFLMLDEFGSDKPGDYLAGFPEHPHRGFETVTYMLAGRMRHHDNQGNTGLLGPGSVQWMTAGRGIMHSEMPEQEDGLMQGFQLWVNLPARDKMCAPRYQDIPADAVPLITPAPGVQVRVLAGSLGDIEGPVRAVATAPVYLDITLQPSTQFSVPLPREHSAFAYVFEGEAVIGDETAVQRGQLAVLSTGDAVTLTASKNGARMILVAGQPLREPVAKYGPFVMNTQQEIVQAVEDFRAGKF
ncbi:pirin family protein [Pseudolysobacter antarcticus]|uniref:Pirin family protein n=1 Tax=Pseudolysobacter antarcticus TaxID=2511995 RepID=A0A411HPS8_9GAMM|nr:pirin family protein [Pseudolysobacter antarcticus]QBB72493.1 pirin family protein [Pseudolysobacter antarcticus]